MTHDIDSKTAMDSMTYFSTYEKQKGITGLYNITTSYHNNGWISAFYNSNSATIQQLINDGHIIGSHSVGHFPDFGNKTHFPLGSTGNTKFNYFPHYNEINNTTTGGSVYGEVEVSKQLLYEDYGVNVTCFRAGHLAFNDSLIYALENLNYKYNSTLSANSILTSFPFYSMKIRSFNGSESSVIEIPMTISDVMDSINQSNYSQMVDIWSNTTELYAANHSPVVLLIHPNRLWKLQAEKQFINGLDQDIKPFSFLEYGQFWRKRENLQLHTTLTNDSLIVSFDNDQLLLSQSFAVDASGLNTVVFLDVNNTPLNFSWIPWENGTRLYYRDEYLSNDIIAPQSSPYITLYPNPTQDYITLRRENNDKAKLIIYNLHGQEVYKSELVEKEKTINLQGLETGVYLLKLIEKNLVSSKKIILRGK